MACNTHGCKSCNFRHQSILVPIRYKNETFHTVNQWKKIFFKVWDYGQVGRRVLIAVVRIPQLEHEHVPMVNAQLRYRKKKQLQHMHAVSIYWVYLISIWFWVKRFLVSTIIVRHGWIFDGMEVNGQLFGSASGGSTTISLANNERVTRIVFNGAKDRVLKVLSKIISLKTCSHHNLYCSIFNDKTFCIVTP